MIVHIVVRITQGNVVWLCGRQRGCCQERLNISTQEGDMTEIIRQDSWATVKDNGTKDDGGRVM